MIAPTDLLTRLRAFIGQLIGRAAVEREMDQEFRSHIALRADDLERRGLPREAAERAARIEFGSVEGYKDAARDSRGHAFGDELRSNAAFAWRGFRRRPLQAVIVVVTLTLGIGISAGVFSTLDVLAFRPRIDGDPASFVRVFSAYGTDSTPPGFPAASRVSDYLAYRDHTPLVPRARRMAGLLGD